MNRNFDTDKLTCVSLLIGPYQFMDLLSLRGDTQTTLKINWLEGHLMKSLENHLMTHGVLNLALDVFTSATLLNFQQQAFVPLQKMICES